MLFRAIAISSWGNIHNVIGRPLKQQFELAASSFFSEIMVYADYRKEAKTKDYDAVSGNALFWNKTIIIDFENKRVGFK